MIYRNYFQLQEYAMLWYLHCTPWLHQFPNKVSMEYDNILQHAHISKCSSFPHSNNFISPIDHTFKDQIMSRARTITVCQDSPLWSAHPVCTIKLVTSWPYCLISIIKRSIATAYPELQGNLKGLLIQTLSESIH